MKLGNIEICYCPPRPSRYSLDQNITIEVKHELLKIKNLRKRTGVAGAMLTIALGNMNVYAQDLNITEFTGKVDEVGNQALNLIQSLGYWAAILFAAIDILKNIKKQDTPGIVAVVLKYITIYGILYALPWIFGLIKTLFAF